MQNISHYNDIFRKKRVETPIPLSDLISSPDKEDQEIGNICCKCYFYHAFRDEIISGESIKDRVLILESSSLSKMIKDKRLFILKGTYQESYPSSGQFFPIVGTAKEIVICQNYLGNLQKESGKPLQVGKDPLSSIERYKNRDRYQDFNIKTILKYASRRDIKNDVEMKINKIFQRLSTTIPEEKAINIQTGCLVNATAACYNVEEYSILLPGTTSRVIVKFASKNTMSNEEKNSLFSLIHSRFNAEKTKPGKVALQQRERITLQAVKATVLDYPNLFGDDAESIQAIFDQSNIASDIGRVDVEVLPPSEIISEEEEEEEEDDIDDDD